jgi:hypothetical protein
MYNMYMLSFISKKSIPASSGSHIAASAYHTVRMEAGDIRIFWAARHMTDMSDLL